MPRATKTPKEKRARQLAAATTKRNAKAREREAKADGKVLDYEETIRARLIKKVGIPPDEWEAFLAVLAKRYRGQFATRPQPRSKRENIPQGSRVAGIREMPSTPMPPRQKGQG